MKIILLFTSFLFLISPVMGQTSAQNWWNKEIFYEVFVRGFQDSNGDGKGDLKGLISRLDYLNDGDPATSSDLGITALWLMPVFDAHSGHGYDTLNYSLVEKDYGTNEDLKLLVKEAHRRGIKVILDLVFNHTSERHPWFQSQLKDPQGPHKDFYLIQTKPFPAYNRVLDTADGKINFFGHFDATTPDLNYANPKVTQTMLAVVDFWIKETGIDGYRLDAIRHLIDENGQGDNSQATHLWLKSYRKAVKAANPQAFSIGEVWDSLENIRPYIPEELDACFNFPLSAALSTSMKEQTQKALFDTLSTTISTFPTNQWGTFLKNHDQPRLMKEWKGNEGMVKLAAGLLLTMPGIPFLYYGEEIGLKENRRAMQWDEGQFNRGFSTAKTVYGNGTQEGGNGRSVSTQLSVPDSILNTYKDLIRLRHGSDALKSGKTEMVESGSPRVLSYLRWTDTGMALVVANVSENPVTDYALTLAVLPQGLSKTTVIQYPKTPKVKVLEPMEKGSLKNWKPLETLAPWGFYVIQFNFSPGNVQF